MDSDCLYSTTPEDMGHNLQARLCQGGHPEEQAAAYDMDHVGFDSPWKHQTTYL